MDMSEFEIYAPKVDEADEIQSVNPCPSCGGIILIGEKNADGVCIDCYYKYSDHDSSTGE
jgi:hypothetical protein